MQSMIFAAGLGTRLKPLTNTRPKALVEINGKTLLEHNVNKMVNCGIRHIVVNVHHFADMIINVCKELSKKYNCRILVSDERELLLNTGGGLLNAKKLFLPDEPILIHNVDILSDLDFNIMEQEFYRTSPLALLAVKQRQTSRYFIFETNNYNDKSVLQLCGWTNIKTNEIIKNSKYKNNNFQLLAFSGIQIVSSNIFSQIQQKGIFSITDMYLQMSENNSIIGYRHEGKWLDVGKLSAIDLARQMF